LVLLDEPFSALDAALRQETRQAVAAALRTAGATALIVTHDQTEALSMGDQVAVLRVGQLVQVAPPAELYRNPVDAELARFMGDTIVIPGSACDGAVTCILGTLRLAHGMPEGAVDVLVRPEQVRLDPGGALKAVVTAVTYYGPSAAVKLRMTVSDAGVLTAQVPGYAAPSVGDEVGFVVEGTVTAWRRVS
jgi:iron(III) transport system ATP-binding protein